MKKVLLYSLLFLFITNSFSQEVTKIETKNLASYGMKKFNNAPKKVFVQDFFINYQMLFDQVEIAKGGREIGGGHRGDAKAQLVLGVQGVSEIDLQEITDKLYTEYVSKLKAKGFEIVSAEEASRNERFKDWLMLEGGTPSKAQFPGYVTTAPTGFKFLTKKISKKGKLKKKSIFDNGMGTSKDLGGIIIARVNIIIPFIKDAESQGSRALTKTFGGVAKIVARPELSVIQNASVETKGVLGKKVILLNTSSLFAYKEGLKYQATLNIVPKKKIVIKGVFEDKKYKAVKSAGQDLWGTGYGAIRVFSASDAVLKKMQAVPCKTEVYKKGVLDASSQYLNKSLNEFLKNIK